MSFFFLVLLFCFFIFLYVLYFLSHDDFVILRTNASMEKIFNAAFVSGFFSLFFARLFYVFLHPRNVFFNPLGFILFPYFPGLSLLGGLLGGYLISLFILKYLNLPAGRIIDFFSTSFLIAFPIGFLGQGFISHEKLFPPFILPIVLYLIVIFVFFRYILRLSLDGKFKEGSLSLLVMSLFPSLYLVSFAFEDFKNSFSPENAVFLISVFVFLFLFLKKEGILERFIFKKQ